MNDRILLRLEKAAQHRYAIVGVNRADIKYMLAEVRRLQEIVERGEAAAFGAEHHIRGL